MKNSFPEGMMDRRTALAALGAAGLGLLGGRHAAAHQKEENVKGVPGAFRAKSRARLSRLLAEPGFSGRISAAEARKLATSEGKSVDALMVELLPLARTYSRPPISNFRVGAVVRGASGDLYFGANVEIPAQALGFTIHAEQAALSNAYMHDEPSVAALAVTDAPCGHCRQFMMDLSPDGSIRILIPGKLASKLSALLPNAFGPKDLGMKRGALPAREVGLMLPKDVSDDLAAAALAAARKSYAPYSKSPSGVAIETAPGRIYKGSYIENAAFNPSLPPFQTALVQLILAGESASSISKAVLVEAEGAMITQKNVAQDTLAALAPAVTLRVVNANV